MCSIIIDLWPMDRRKRFDERIEQTYVATNDEAPACRRLLWFVLTREI